MDAHATVRSKCNHVHQAGSEQVLFKGRLKMGFEGLFNQDAMQMGQRGDTTTGLLLLSGYALLALRFAIKTRLYDFRLPSYADRPVADQADKHDMALRRANGLPALAPDMHRLEVPRGSSNSDQGTESTEPLTLPLWRYRQLGADQTPQIPDVQLIEEEGGESPRVHKVKAVLLLHAFGQSGLSYTYKDPESSCGSNLAEAFYAQGYEVWLLDSRMSSRSGYAELAQTVDMQGEHDVPCAVDHILKTLQTELRLSEETTCLQISVFAQCIGAAALWMAALSGRLSHPTLGRHGLPIPKLSAAMFSQVHALIQGMPLTRSKVWLPALLEKVLPFIPFAVRGAQNGLLWQWTDRLLSSMPVPEAERKLTDDEDGLATCRRIRFIEAPLFKHENMRPGTVQDMNRLFGPANLRLFGHARRFVEYERLVDEDGFNRYVNDKNLHDHLNFPIQLLHGEDNELFDVAGARKTFEWLKRRPSCVPQEEAPLIIKGYGHLDVLLGHNAARDVFAPVLDFFSQAHGSSPPQTVCASPSARWRVAAPRVGPLVGWVRREGTDLVVRLAIAIDDLHGGSTEDGDTHILVRRSDGAGGFLLHIADAKFVPLKHPGMSESTAPEAVALRCAQIDVRLHPTQYAGACQAGQALAFQVMSLHKILAPPATTQSLWISTNALGPLDLVKTALAPGWQRRLPSAFPWVAAQHLLNGQIAQALAADQAEVDAHNQVAELDGLRKRASVLERVAFSVPVATCHALLSNAEPGPSHGVSFLASCCRHPGLTVDRNRIDEALAHVQNARDRKAPAFALLVGDQIYADATAGLVDPTSPVERYLERYETALTAAPMRRFLAHMPTFMTPDDHEWTNNYPHAAPLHIRAWPDWGYEGSFRGVNGAWATWARASMRSFQRLQGPFATGKKKHAHQYGVGNFGPVRVFVIDTRQRRHRGLPEVVVNQTFNDLQRWLCAGSKDVLNVVVTGSVLLPGLHADADPANPGAMDTWQSAPDQRQRALDMLVRRCVGTPHRFLLVSGDYHVSVALQIRVGSETHSTVVGAAVVVPPLYAPMPYVNSCPEHLWLDEPLAVAGQALELVVPQNGEPRVGSGLAHITVGCTAAGFKISVHRELQVFEQGLLPSNTASTAVFTV
ncbi:alkaline phosphatase D family protein [Hydrogenophaga sp.]|uniref:alkaline phosphatase D family protein n=1 Tax=Hydrogenophaga sp. TaxID=1904254 RepID=UPI003564C4AF